VVAKRKLGGTSLEDAQTTIATYVTESGLSQDTKDTIATDVTQSDLSKEKKEVYDRGGFFGDKRSVVDVAKQAVTDAYADKTRLEREAKEQAEKAAAKKAEKAAKKAKAAKKSIEDMEAMPMQDRDGISMTKERSLMVEGANKAAQDSKASKSDANKEQESTKWRDGVKSGQKSIDPEAIRLSQTEGQKSQLGKT
jgi:hypothetical protein